MNRFQQWRNELTEDIKATDMAIDISHRLPALYKATYIYACKDLGLTWRKLWTTAGLALLGGKYEQAKDA